MFCRVGFVGTSGRNLASVVHLTMFTEHIPEIFDASKDSPLNHLLSLEQTVDVSNWS